MSELPDFTIQYSVRRRRVGVTLDSTGGVVILAPPGFSERKIRFLLRQQPEVIENLRHKFQERSLLTRHWAFVEGEMFPLLGEEYPLKLTARLLFFDRAFLVPRGTPEEIKQYIETIYRKIAQKKLAEETQELAQKFNLTVSGVGITGADTRWGSCSRRGKINYSWKLLMCNKFQVNYVVCHELAHLTEFNHSERFWDLVGNYCPDYRTQRATMKKILIDW